MIALSFAVRIPASQYFAVVFIAVQRTAAIYSTGHHSAVIIEVVPSISRAFAFWQTLVSGYKYAIPIILPNTVNLLPTVSHYHGSY